MNLPIEWKQSPNCYDGREGQPITTIVLHYTAALTLDSTLWWFAQRGSRVSAHYVIGRNGRIVQMVRDEDAAWHAGDRKVNLRSIGIELVGTGQEPFTVLQLTALDELLTALVARYRIAPDQVVGHSQVCPGRKVDPEGPHGETRFPWARVRQVAAEAYGATSEPHGEVQP